MNVIVPVATLMTKRLRTVNGCKRNGTVLVGVSLHGHAALPPRLSAGRSAVRSLAGSMFEWTTLPDDPSAGVAFRPRTAGGDPETTAHGSGSAAPALSSARL